MVLNNSVVILWILNSLLRVGWLIFLKIKLLSPEIKFKHVIINQLNWQSKDQSFVNSLILFLKQTRLSQDLVKTCMVWNWLTEFVSTLFNLHIITHTQNYINYICIERKNSTTNEDKVHNIAIFFDKIITYL